MYLRVLGCSSLTIIWDNLSVLGSDLLSFIKKYQAVSLGCKSGALFLVKIAQWFNLLMLGCQYGFWQMKNQIFHFAGNDEEIINISESISSPFQEGL